MNYDVQVFVPKVCFISLGDIPMGWIAGSFGKYMINLKRMTEPFFREITQFLFPTSNAQGFYFSTLLPAPVAVFLLYLPYSVKEWYLIMAFICLSLIANDLETL